VHRPPDAGLPLQTVEGLAAGAPASSLRVDNLKGPGERCAIAGQQYDGGILGVIAQAAREISRPASQQRL